MKRIVSFLILSMTCFPLLFLGACGVSEDGSSTTTTRTADVNPSSSATSLSGVVADGYLTSARVFLDRNRNRLYDNGEPMAQSGVGGAFTLQVNPGEGDQYPVLAEALAGETVDEDTGVTVPHDYLLEAPPGRWTFVSPLTTLVNQELEKNPSFTEQQAVLAVKSEFGLDDDISLFSDYLAEGTGLPDDELQRTHKAAQVAANLMGQLRMEITANLGGQVADEEQNPVAYMIGDQILGEANQVKQGLDNERNFGTSVNVEALTTQISDAIDEADLDSDLLVLYEQRISQGMETWDMTPPQLLSRSPLADDTASVDAIVTMTFDEPLDETLLSSGLVWLSGPGGTVAGVLDFDPEQNRLTFTPDQPLIPYSNYQVSVDGSLADVLGNPLGQDLVWAFSTVFDMTPPPLPEF